MTAAYDIRPSAAKPKKPMPKLIWDADYWEFRAEEARATLSEVRNPDCQRIMGEIADAYERLARLSVSFKEAAIAAGRVPPK
jgi:hypothetical protein